MEKLKEYLQSDNKDMKHEAWNYVESHYKELGKDFIIEMLKFQDTGTRYRAWNFVKKLVDENFLTVKECRDLSPYFLEMLEDKNLTVRALSWYVTLMPLIELGIIDKGEVVKNYSKYLCEIYEQYKDVLEEVKEELKIEC
ncbi:hypothetical protein [Acidianus sp. HS-5]|uniref:hypothetical protein n=1 Tax=Acidianus sp. HS-5 TaxID=2886040 RepID=UPI001F217D48|nr:hypothetical protein [Acidianus sp. HS-5]BDC17703.1 hypothetical protein HS5_05930 [Acidianus sp. HS-5]